MQASLCGGRRELTCRPAIAQALRVYAIGELTNGFWRRFLTDCASRSTCWADAWIKQKFARGLELRAADPGPFNYPLEVFSEWRGKTFYLESEDPAPRKLNPRQSDKVRATE